MVPALSSLFQPMHSPYQRPQPSNYSRNPNAVSMSNRSGNATGIPSNVVNNGNNAGASMASRQAGQQHQQQSHAVPIMMSPLYLPNYQYPRGMQGFVPGSSYGSAPIYVQHPAISYMNMVQPQTHRSNAGAVQSMPTATLGTNVGASSVAGANAQQQQQQPTPHQSQMNQHYLQQQVNSATAINVPPSLGSMYPVAPPPQQQKGKEKKILEIIDPKTGENILEGLSSKKPQTSGSVTLAADTQHSGQSTGAISQLDVHEASAAAVHAPAITPVPLVLGQVDHDAYNIEQREILNDVPPTTHTPVVSAAADGPSVDIPPKPAKNIKRK